jgi:hypothetical protein
MTKKPWFGRFPLSIICLGVLGSSGCQLEGDIGNALDDSARTGAGDPDALNADLQRRAADVLASIPGGHQVSATEIDYDGLTVTLDPKSSAETSVLAPGVSCASGHFCIIVGGNKFDFVACRMWDLSNWNGSAPYLNNQTGHVIAQAFNADATQVVFSNTSVSWGTEDVRSWWHFKPC